MAETRVCKREGCGVLFVPRHHRQLYCSDACSYFGTTGHFRVRPSVCQNEWCGEVLDPNRSTRTGYHQIYCHHCCELKRIEAKRRQQECHKMWVAKNRSKILSYTHFDRLLVLAAKQESFVQKLEEKMSKKELDLGSALKGLEKKTTAQLKRLFAEGFRLQREALIRQAACLKLLDERGEEVEADRQMLDLYRSIYQGKWLPDVVVKFGCRPETMRRVGAKPKEEQARLLQMSVDDVEKELGHRKKVSIRELPLDKVVSDLVNRIYRSADPVSVAKRLLPTLQRIAEVKKTAG